MEGGGGSGHPAEAESGAMEDPSLAMLDWMEYEATAEAFIYPCESCGASISLERPDVDEGGATCAQCGGRLLLLDDDEFDAASPLPYDSETINHSTLVVDGTLNLEVRVLPGSRVSWKFAEQAGDTVDFTASYAFHDQEFELRAPITIVQPGARSELSSNFTMRSGGQLLLRFTNPSGDGSERTEVLRGAGSAEDGGMPELEPEPELAVPGSGFSLDTDDAGAISIYGTLPPPAVAAGSSSARRVNVAISRLPPFATADGDMSGVITAPDGRAGPGTAAGADAGSASAGGGGGGRLEAPRVGAGGSSGGGEGLEMAELSGGPHSEGTAAGTSGGVPGFTIQEGTVLPPGLGGQNASRKKPAGESGGGLSESLLS
jgi:hypothetical protein